MTDTAVSLATKWFAISNSELVINGQGVSALAEKYGTPAFVYDQRILDRKLAALRAALPPAVEVCYSVKANPNPFVLRHFVSRGCGLEIASGGEFLLALKAGCAPEQILFAGPGKTEAELKLVLSRDIGEIHLESATEAYRISSIARGLGKRANVAVRINPAGEVQGGAMRMGGRALAFGVDEEILDDILDLVLAEPFLNFRGIHLFTGTQILDADVLLAQYQYALELAHRVATRIGQPLHTVDFGGGLGIPYFSHEKEIDLERLHAGLSSTFANIGSDPQFRGTRFLVEPGRFLVGEAGIYLTRVLDVKVSRGKKFVIVDGGMNHHLAASGNLGQTIKRNYPVAIVNKFNQPGEETVDVVGPLCTPLDTIARSVTLPTPQIGDLFGIFQSGAYARTASPLGFLSHPEPPEIWITSEGHSNLTERCAASARRDELYSELAAQ